MKKKNGKCTACGSGFALDYENIANPKCAELQKAIKFNCEIDSLQDEVNDEGVLESACLACK